MTKTFTSLIGHLDKLKMHHITVSEEILQSFKGDAKGSIYNQRFHVQVNNGETWQGGTVSLGNKSAYITFSKARMNALDLHFGDKVTVQLILDTSEYGFDVPEEFEELLKQDDMANQRFESLTKGFRRSIIYLVLQLKSSDKRIAKSIFLLENLKRAPIGKETMRHVLGKDLH